MNHNIQIRKMQKKDLPQIQKLYKDLIPEGVSMDTLEQHFDAIAELPRYFLAVAVSGERVLGSTMGIICIALDAPFLVVENVIVDNGCRGQGISRQIFDALDRYAIEHNCEYAILVSSGFRKQAHKFYEAMGYTDDVRGFRKYYKT